MDFDEQNQKRQKPQRSPKEVFDEIQKSNSWLTRLNILVAYRKESEDGYITLIRGFSIYVFSELPTMVNELGHERLINTQKLWCVIVLMSSEQDEYGIPIIIDPDNGSLEKSYKI